MPVCVHRNSVNAVISFYDYHNRNNAFGHVKRLKETYSRRQYSKIARSADNVEILSYDYGRGVCGNYSALPDTSRFGRDLILLRSELASVM